MQGRPAGPQCCGRCAGAQAAARVARRQHFRAAVFARPGGLPDADDANDTAGAERPASAQRAATGDRCSAGAGAADHGADGTSVADRADHRTGRAGPADRADHPTGRAGPADRTNHPAGRAGRFRTVTGTLVDVSPHTLVVATGEGERRLALGPGSPVWRGRMAAATELRPGERVVIRLAPGRSDVADKIWASIGRVAGTISASDAGQLVVDEGTTRRPQAVTISPAAANRIRVRFPQLEPGNLIDVIGLRRGAALEALIPATSQPAYLASRVTRGSAVVKTSARTSSWSETMRVSSGWRWPPAPRRGAASPPSPPGYGRENASWSGSRPAAGM